ncbi:MAG: hypothetical protein K9K65_06090 [Desulfarculaceae bacterium]|nr:hypothetical protein [Desulfarculaceae bacterium]MCF8097396.1 hypothetical protein [Desulfarculaceae bacterium]MCF8123820.1 hypothetical protein [Desulfarculaceae bacterium]
MHHLAEKIPTRTATRPLGSPGCDHYAGGEACSHPANELGICATGLCPVTVEATEKGRQALARKQKEA